MISRITLSLLVLCSLAACERNETPSAETAQNSASEASVVVQSTPVVKTVVEPEPERAPAAVVARKPKAEKPAETAPPVLDLSLPQELLDAVSPGEPLTLKPLLPSLFGREAESDFRLGGRLIESPEQDRAYDGAELKIEIKR